MEGSDHFAVTAISQDILVDCAEDSYRSRSVTRDSVAQPLATKSSFPFFQSELNTTSYLALASPIKAIMVEL